MSEARVALIGYGLAGAVFHAPFVAAVDGLELAAIVTRDPERRERARDEHPAAELLDSAEDVWLRAAELSLVVVATPNRTHVPLAEAAIGRELAVVVDKPFAPTAAQARRLVDSARERGVLLTVFQNRRWDGDVLTLRGLLDEGALGDVIRFESRFDRWRPEVGEGWRESAEPEDAGGLLNDLGPHLVDQALWLFGPASSIYAEIDCRRPGARVDDDVFVSIAHESGVRSHLWASTLAAQPTARLRVLGERAAYVKYGMDVQEEQLREGKRPTDPGFGEEPEEHWGTVGAAENMRRVPTQAGAYLRFYEGVAASLRDGEPPPVEPVEAVAALEVLEAARTSARERRLVAVVD